ncbi:MAG TPA: CocE/NonD family hydrolase [Pseudonocardiaceae bacterium]
MRKIALLVGALLFTLVAPISSVPAAAAGAFTVQPFTVTASDGVQLRGHALVPDGSGPFPTLVLPNSWGLNQLEYVVPASDFARAGYVVVSYTTRGFWESGGQIDVAGPRDIADARLVIDWALANTPADSDRVGMAGISYGSGISLLTAAADPRVRAVAAMSTWGDLERSLLPNSTWSQQSIGLLDLSARLTGRPGQELLDTLDAYYRNDRAAAVRLAASRSPIAVVDRINANRPAVLIANGWSDSLFPAGQIVDLYERLQVPKRLELVPGDHATPELTGIFGLPNETWDSVRRWFDHHLRDLDNGVDRELPVQVRPTLGGPWQSYPTWSALVGDTQRFYLSDLDPVVNRDGELTATPRTGWSHTVAAGVDTTATGGISLLTGGLEQLGIPQWVWLPSVLRTNAGVWQTPVLDRARQVRGAPTLHVTITPSTSRVTLVAYLYDVDALGNGRLLTHQPLTLLDATPGAARAVDITLDPLVHTVPAGHRIAVVVDTVDGLYRGESRIGSTVTFRSPAGDPSYLDVPLA